MQVYVYTHNKEKTKATALSTKLIKQTVLFQSAAGGDRVRIYDWNVRIIKNR